MEALVWLRIGGAARAGVRAGATIAALGFALALSAILPAASSAETGPASVSTWNSAYEWPLGAGYAGWNAEIDSPNPAGYLLVPALAGEPGPAIGLTGDMEYRPGRAAWAFVAPGTTRIAAATLNLSWRSDLFAHHCLAVGLRAADGARDEREHCSAPATQSTPGAYSVSLADPGPLPTATEAFFELRMPACADPGAGSCAKWIPGRDPAKNGPVARLREARILLVDDDLPVIAPSGRLFEIDGRYTDGAGSYDLSVAAADGGAGIATTRIDHLTPPPEPGTAVLAARAAACDPAHHTPELGSRICPPGDSVSAAVDTGRFPEGANVVRAWARDPAGNVGERRLTVKIDRTPPEPPVAPHFITPAKGAAQAYWNESRDPALADGTRGSGTTHYRFRSQIGADPWSAWTEAPRARQISDEIYDQPTGTLITFEIVAVDAVGNLSSPATVTGFVHDPDPDDPTPGGSGVAADEAPDAPAGAEPRTDLDPLLAHETTGAVPIELLLEPGSSPAPFIAAPIWNSSYLWPAGSGYSTWTQVKRTSLPAGYELRAGHGGAPGLWLWPVGSKAAGGAYPPGYAEFTLRAPGTTRIARAGIDIAYRNNLYATHCTQVGLRDQLGPRAGESRCAPPAPSSGPLDPGAVSRRDVGLFDPSFVPSATEAFVRIELPDCASAARPTCARNIPALDPLTNGPFLHVEAIRLTLVDDDLPVVTPSGPPAELDGGYADGSATYDLTLDAADAGAGIAAARVDHVGPAPGRDTETLAAASAPCDPTHNTPQLLTRICPPNHQVTARADTADYPEGAHTFRLWARDPAGNVGQRDLTLAIDRTPPPAPRLRPIRPDSGSAQVYWHESLDPPLPDGVRGSGTTHYRYRSRIDAGAWTDWTEVSRSRQISDEVFDQPMGTVIAFEVQAVDAVGNASPISSREITVRGKAPTVAIVGELAALDGEDTRGLAPVVALVNSTDDEAGVRGVRLTEQPQGAFDQQRDAGCADAGIRFAPGKLACPRAFDTGFTVPMAQLTEGAHTFTAVTTDRSQNTATSQITTYIDRTPPPPPTEIELTGEFGYLNADWDSGDDPDLPDGLPGSGVDHFEIRYSVDTAGGGAWSPWEAVPNEAFSFYRMIPGLVDGSTMVVEIRTVDLAGNVSDVASATAVHETSEEPNHSPSFGDVHNLVMTADAVGELSGYSWWDSSIGIPYDEITVTSQLYRADLESDPSVLGVPVGAPATATCAKALFCDADARIPLAIGRYRVRGVFRSTDDRESSPDHPKHHTETLVEDSAPMEVTESDLIWQEEGLSDHMEPDELADEVEPEEPEDGATLSGTKRRRATARRKCTTHRGRYTIRDDKFFDFDTNNPLTVCRRGKYGYVDKGDNGAYLHGTRSDGRTKLKDITHDEPGLQLNSSLSPKKRRWNLLDSFGSTLGYVESAKAAEKRVWTWSLTGAAGEHPVNVEAGKSAKLTLMVQSMACLDGGEGKNDAWYKNRRKYVMLVWKQKVRAFVNRRALPSLVKAKLLEQRRDVGCKETGRVKAGKVAAEPDGKFLPQVHRFRTPATLFTPGKEKFHSNKKQNGKTVPLSYATYNPRPLPEGTDTSYIYILANTTVVRGGGVARAIVPVNDSVRITVYDYFSYCDPNGFAPDAKPEEVDMNDTMQWAFVRVGRVGADAVVKQTRIWGWMPMRFLAPIAEPSLGIPGHLHPCPRQ